VPDAVSARSASATPARPGRNLRHLARTPQTDRDRPAPAWPAPLGVEPALAPSPHPRDQTGPLPISPGQWGRPPVGARRPALPPWTPLGAPPPPPLPPERPATEEPRRRQRGVVVEVGVAVAILLTVALMSGRGGASSAPAPSTAITAWDRRAVPVITQLVGDLTAIERDTAPNQGFSLVRLRHDDTDLRRDVVTAQGLGSPPADSALAALWTLTLQQLAGGQVVLDEAVARPTSAAIAHVHQQLALAGDGVLQLGQNVQSER
jgi:hypothetical protein